MLSREEATKLLYDHMSSVNLRRHSLAVAAVMRALAKRLGGNEEKWEIVGILHDADYEETRSDPNQHTLRAVEWLALEGETDEEIKSAILSHNFAHTGENPPKNNMEWSLYACDELTGFIVAVALVKPDKKLSSVTVDSVLKKWPEKAFAAGVHRGEVESCEEKLGIPLKDFVEIALRAMQGVSDDLGL